MSGTGCKGTAYHCCFATTGFPYQQDRCLHMDTTSQRLQQTQRLPCVGKIRRRRGGGGGGAGGGGGGGRRTHHWVFFLYRQCHSTNHDDLINFVHMVVHASLSLSLSLSLVSLLSLLLFVELNRGTMFPQLLQHAVGLHVPRHRHDRRQRHAVLGAQKEVEVVSILHG